MKKEFYSTEVSQICAKHKIEIKTIKSITGSFDKKIFFINGDLHLRVSTTSMELEQKKFRRIAALQFVPEIKHIGMLECEAGPLYYTLLTFLPLVFVPTKIQHRLQTVSAFFIPVISRMCTSPGTWKTISHLSN